MEKVYHKLSAKVKISKSKERLGEGERDKEGDLDWTWDIKILHNKGWELSSIFLTFDIMIISDCFFISFNFILALQCVEQDESWCIIKKKWWNEEILIRNIRIKYLFSYIFKTNTFKGYVYNYMFVCFYFKDIALHCLIFVRWLVFHSLHNSCHVRCYLNKTYIWMHIYWTIENMMRMWWRRF